MFRPRLPYGPVLRLFRAECERFAKGTKSSKGTLAVKDYLERAQCQGFTPSSWTEKMGKEWFFPRERHFAPRPDKNLADLMLSDWKNLETAAQQGKNLLHLLKQLQMTDVRGQEVPVWPESRVAILFKEIDKTSRAAQVPLLTDLRIPRETMEPICGYYEKHRFLRQSGFQKFKKEIAPFFNRTSVEFQGNITELFLQYFIVTQAKPLLLCDPAAPASLENQRIQNTHIYAQILNILCAPQGIFASGYIPWHISMENIAGEKTLALWMGVPTPVWRPQAGVVLL